MVEKKQTKRIRTDIADQALEELKNDLQRVQADFVNFRRRIDSERSELLLAAKEAVVEQLLPMFDNLDRALAHAPAELADNAWVQGVAQVAKQVAEALESLGVTAYGQVGEVFDPKLHEAIAHEGEGEAIIEVFQKGYRSGERVIRPAMVKVGHLKKEGKS